MLACCNINDENNNDDVSVDIIALTEIGEYMSYSSEIFSIPKEYIDAYHEYLEREYDISSNSESDLSSDDGYSVNE
jgi:hypothetical protein